MQRSFLKLYFKAFLDDTFHAVEEFAYAVQSVFVPGSALDVAETEHQVHSENVGAELRDAVVGRYDVASRLGHLVAVRTEYGALVNKGQERFVEVEITHIPESFGKEPCVQQVHAGVLRSAYIFIDGQHFVYPFGVERLVRVLVVGITQIVPARTHESIESVGVASCGTSAHRTRNVHELLALCKRAFSVGLEVHVVRQTNGQILFGDGNNSAMFAVYHGNGCAPVTLTADKPVAQAVVGFERAFAFLFQFLDDGDFAFFRSHAVELAGVDHNAVIAERQFVVAVHGFDDSFDGQAQFLCEHVVTFVVSGNAHDRARAVACENVVGNQNGNFPAVDGVDCVCARHDARFLPVGSKTVDFSGFGRVVFVFLDGGFLFGSGNDVDKRIFGSKHDVRHAEGCVRSRGEHAESFFSAFDCELDFSAVRLAYPVFLHKFGLFGPIQFVKVTEKFVGVFRDFEEPLSKVFSHDRASATFAFALNDLLVCKHRVAGRAPVDGCFLAVGKTLFVKLQEKPLRPFVVLGSAGVKFVIPVVHRTDFFELVLHRRNVFHRAVLRVNARLYRVVFGGKSESVEAHGLKHFVTLHFLETRISVGGTVIVPVSGMQFRARRVREHFEHIPFLVYSVAVELVKSGVRPDFLPLAFNLFEVHYG